VTPITHLRDYQRPLRLPRKDRHIPRKRSKLSHQDDRAAREELREGLPPAVTTAAVPRNCGACGISGQESDQKDRGHKCEKEHGLVHAPPILPRIKKSRSEVPQSNPMRWLKQPRCAPSASCASRADLRHRDQRRRTEGRRGGVLGRASR
jgi:hypothetical protein